MFSGAKYGALALLILAAIDAPAHAGRPCCQPTAAPVSFGPSCQLVMKSYRIEAKFCPQEVAAMIAQQFPCGVPCAGCGPYGVPPLYVVASYVMVRQTPEGQELVSKYLQEIGAYVPQPLAP